MDVAIPPIQATNKREGAINLDGIPEPARCYDRNYYAQKMQAEDMKNVKTFLQQGPLTVAGIEKFNLWKEDILRATRSVNLTGQEHWTTINRLIETCMDDNVYQTVANFFPANREAMAALNPETLLNQIETRLITADQLKYK